MAEFDQGRVYSRQRDIHAQFGGQRQGGISTPADYPLIFLFTGESGVAHGYSDRFQPDGMFWYTGEGQVGDMEMVRGNRAVRDHVGEGKKVYLFQDLGKGGVRSMGEAVCLGHHTEERLDTVGQVRRAIVFELALNPSRHGDLPSQAKEPERPSSEKRLKDSSLAELRRLATEHGDHGVHVGNQRRNVYVRSEAVRAYVLRRADGKCEGCGVAAPFLDRRRQPYLEPHHTTRLADGGPDHPAYVIALCPNCHRRVHHARDGKTYNEHLIGKLVFIERKVSVESR